MIALMVLAFFISNGQALECGSIIGESRKEFSQVVGTCLAPTLPVPEEKTESAGPEVDSDDLERSPVYVPRRGLHGRYTRDDQKTNQSENCVAKCIFEHFALLDSNGFPKHQSIWDELQKGIIQTEFKDFLQDTIDGCFKQILGLGINLDACAYSTKLALCLAEQGVQNCADWPIGELPFPASP